MSREGPDVFRKGFVTKTKKITYQSLLDRIKAISDEINDYSVRSKPERNWIALDKLITLQLDPVSGVVRAVDSSNNTTTSSNLETICKAVRKAVP